MEASKDHPAPFPGRVKQRFALRASPKGKEDKTSNDITIIPKREKRLLSVSKSVSQLDLSVKDKHARSARRLSVPSKYATPVSKPDKKLSSSTPSSTITEIKSTSKPDFVLGPLTAENKGKATAKSFSVSFQGSFSRSQGKANGASKDAMSTPANGSTVQEVPKSGQRRKFSTLTSSSYWLSQIKLAESAGKHAISLGFFRLALESSAEPLQRVRDELKSYVKKHGLLDLGEVAKEVLQKYGVLEEVTADVEAKVGPKENVSQVPEAFPLIPENVEEEEEEEEESHNGSDCMNSKKKAKDACSLKVHVGTARKAIRSDANRNAGTEPAEKLDGVASPIDRNRAVQKRKKPSTLPVTKSQASSVVRKSSNANPSEKASPVNSHRHAARRTSLNPPVAKNGQNEIKEGSQKDKGSNMNKPSQLDLPSSMDSNTEQDKENLDFQQMETTSIQKETDVTVQG